jgi:3-oxoacyl-[acyl-carrier protein] reductase
MRDRVAVVTGGSRGIGRAVAELLAQEGCHLELVARDSGALDALASSLRDAHGIEVRTHALDLGDPASWAALAEAASATDILVNNAGAVPPGGITDLEHDALLQGWGLKVFGYVGLMRAFYPRMKERRRGVIVNVIGMAGERVNADVIALTGGNAALIAMTRALGARSPEFGVRVVGVNPSATATNRALMLWRKQAEVKFGDPERWPETLSRLPFGRAAEPAEVAAAVVFLASDRAGYISGSVINVDGGIGARP